MSTKISDDFMSLEIDILTPRETALYGPQATKVAARAATDPVRAENLVHGSGQQSCSPCRPVVMIIGHVPAVHVPPDHAAGCVAAARPA